MSRRSHRAAKLHHRMSARYALVTAPMTFGALTIQFTRIADPDRVLDDLAAATDLQQRLTGQRDNVVQHLPYWAELWDSAIGIAAHLANLPVVAGNVLDLGCGMGLTGTVAAARGARVTFADMEADALLLAQVNGAPYDAVGRLLNWQTDRLDEKFDLILGADILYERKQWEFLEPFWRAHLAPGGHVLIGEPGRPTGDDFPAWIQPRGWRFEMLEQKVATREKAIRLFKLSPV